MSQKPLIIGHRGAAGEAPENTISSFQLALEQGAQGIELDVHPSKDGYLMVCHDPTIDRTTDKSGSINEMTAAELKQADAGAWFSEKFKGEAIPLLDEVLDLVPDTVMLNVEIKESYGGLVESKLVWLLQSKKRLGSTVISSFDHKCLFRLKILAPEARIGLLYASNVMNHRRFAETFGAEVYSLHPEHRLIDDDDVTDAVNGGLQVYPYTANSEQDLRRLIAAGASGIITDYPARLKQILDSM